MKKIVLLLSFVSLFWACQKKEYATFNYSQSAYMHRPEAMAPVTPVPVVRTPQPMMASASEDLSVVLNEEISVSAIPSKAIHSSVGQATGVAAHEAAPTEMTRTQKAIAKKIQKKIDKAGSPEKDKVAKAKPDTIALLSLIFGGTGLLLLLLGSGLGLLLGIAGLVMGIIGLTRIKKDKAPASSKTMALLGVIFGGVVTLVGLIVIAAISSYGFY